MDGLLATTAADGVLTQGAAALDLGRGAIAGAFVVGAAFLAGYAAVRRSGVAFCALLMVVLAAALEFSWLGLLPSLPSEGVVFILGLFVASAIVFLSATVTAARHNPLLGGVFFTSALILGGLGVINFVDRIDAAPIMRWAAVGVGGLAVVIVISQALRGDNGARLILPGVALAIAASLIGPLGSLEAAAASSLLPHGLFTLGILAASLVCLTDGFPSPAAVGALRSDMDGLAVGDAQRAAHHAGFDASASYATRRRERTEIIIDSQLGRVLDYSGVAIWDWSPEMVDQTDSLPHMLGADSDAPFTPDAMRQFVHKDDMKLLETEVLAATDGPFDVALRLFDGRLVRMRGARAATETAPAELERVVAFIEQAGPTAAAGAVDAGQVQNATKAAIVPAGIASAAAFDIDAIKAVFQPIVALDNAKTVGYEALARLNGEEGDTASLIRAAAHAGKSTALAKTMLDQAAAFLARERETHKGAAPDFVAMNVSWSQMQDPVFARAVEAAIKKHDLPKGAIVLELTEGEAVGEAPAAGDVFKKLKGLGAGLAFDDFGAGFSCLSNVRKYDFDYIKIDKSFTDDLEKSGDGAKIVSALASMGGDLGLKVIIEGIESQKAAKAAQKLGCAYGQGFALGRPGAPVDTARAPVKTAAVDEKAAPAPAKIEAAAAEPPKDQSADAPDSDDVKPSLAAAPADETKTAAEAPASNDDAPEDAVRWRPWRRTSFRS